MTSKSLNPYDTSAPTELFGDPVVRVFDARMPTRPGPPLQFSMLGAPRLVRFLADESLALASSSGQFLVSKEPFTGEFFFFLLHYLFVYFNVLVICTTSQVL